jgi:hypothetical protein
MNLFIHTYKTAFLKIIHRINGLRNAFATGFPQSSPYFIRQNFQVEMNSKGTYPHFI